jgi:hypothetical protein
VDLEAECCLGEGEGVRRSGGRGRGKERGGGGSGGTTSKPLYASPFLTTVAEVEKVKQNLFISGLVELSVIE